ncbi:MAG: hypothetical protein LBD20_03135 [Spirochaetaceae bacterium]|jgi:hypothetical protein|nr:hypothetical protein [Spirochaetaceae bacterium]
MPYVIVTVKDKILAVDDTTGEVFSGILEKHPPLAGDELLAVVKAFNDRGCKTCFE